MTPMLSELSESEQSAHVLNTCVDSLDLRLLRFATPSPWLTEQILKWREYHQTFERDDAPLVIQLAGVGSFTLKPTRDRHYEFVLINPEIADIRIFNPDKWASAIAGQTGQFYISFRSKFLQFHGTEAVYRCIKALTAALCTPFDDSPGWNRVSRADLAADVQLPHAYDWADLNRFVTRARQQELVTANDSVRVKLRSLLSTPPSDNKGGATYKEVGVDFLTEVLEALESMAPQDGHIYRTIGKGSLQTIYFGRFSSPLYARLYDKEASLDQQRKGYMRDIWREAGWDGESPVWRHEFSMSGDFLRSIANLETGEVEDLRDFDLFLSAIPNLWRYLTCEWLRFTEPNPDDPNRWRWSVADTWAVLQAAFQTATSIARRHPPRRPDEGQLKAQMLGVALTLAAKRSTSDQDMTGAAEVFKDICTWLDSPDYRDSLTLRRQVLGIDDFSDTYLSALYRAERLSEGLGS
jgi:hypothetical protein